MPSLIDIRRRVRADQVDAADHEGHEDGLVVEAAPRAGAHRAQPAVRAGDAARVQQPGDARRRRRASAAAGRPAGGAHAADRDHAPTAACAAASTPTSSRRAAQFITEQPARRRAARWRWRWSAARAATSSCAAASTSATRKSACSRTSSGRTRRRSPTPAIKEFLGARRRARSISSTTSSSRSWRSGWWSSGCCRSRSWRTGAGGRPTVDYLFEPSPEELLDTLLPFHVAVQVNRALLESSAAEHAARMTAMDARHAQRQGDGRPADALHEQGAAGGDHARDHRDRRRSTVGCRRVDAGRADASGLERLRTSDRHGNSNSNGHAERRQGHSGHRPGRRHRVRGGHLPAIYNAVRIVAGKTRRRRRDRHRVRGAAAPGREPRPRGGDEADRRHAARHDGDRHRRADLGAGRPGDARPRAQRARRAGRLPGSAGRRRRSAGRSTAPRRRSSSSRPS